MSVPAPNLTVAWARAIVDELAKGGVRDLVTSPGSRSAPLALAAADDVRLRDRSILDERSAAFFALGLARASRRPVALVCTSGTAVANWLPAAVEARLGGTPLVLLSADRPAELRGRAAPQTIDQAGLFARYPRFEAELGIPETTTGAFRALRSTVSRAVFEAIAQCGPVHLNVPLREPLAPVPDPSFDAGAIDPLALQGREGRPWTRASSSGAGALHAEDVAELAHWISEEPRGWLVAGPLDADAETSSAIARLARGSRWPLLTDLLSPLRSAPGLEALRVCSLEALLCRDLAARDELPRRVLRIGGIPTSKRLLTWLDASAEIETCVVASADWPDPGASASELLRADPLGLAHALCQHLDPEPELSGFARRWIEDGRSAERALAGELDAHESEPGLARAFVRSLPSGTTVFVGNSLPVRDLDSFWPADAAPLRVLANRGANGIDGSLSCALGVAAGSQEPSVALLGDLAFLHDASGLVTAAQQALDLTVVVFDNRGGGIFEQLPAALHTPREAFERHLATPQNVDLALLAAGAGIETLEVAGAAELGRRMRDSLARGGTRLLRVRSDRRASAEQRSKLLEDAAAGAAHA